MVVNAEDTVIWHDLECGCYSADLALWHELCAGETGAAPNGAMRGSSVRDSSVRGDAVRGDAVRGGAVLDIGAGSGRVALELARAGHHVTALDLDAALLRALRERAHGLDIETACADARTFALARRDFAVCIAPMQTLQLLGGAAGRARFLRCARAHLAPGGLLACAIVTDVDPFDCDSGDAGPSPETVRVGDVTYVSRARRVRVDHAVTRIERERSVLTPALGSTHPQLQHDVIELDRLSAAQLQREGREAGFATAGTRAIPATEEHTGSVAVMFRA
jgi:SAM-dependent methyltransferase